MSRRTVAGREALATLDEVATFLGVSPQTVRHWRKKHIGPKCGRVGKHIRYAWRDVESWFEEQKNKPL
nr:helix-turn-helix domain-containing protein [Micromonospora sp. DSM 115978]